MTRPLRVLVVEDEAIIALQLEEDIYAAGHEVAGCAMNSREARELFDRGDPDVALVDIHLADGPTGIGLARAFADAGCLVIFMTANVKRIPLDFAGAVGVIAKPYTSAGLHRGLTYIAGCLAGERELSPPGALTMAPLWAADRRHLQASSGVVGSRRVCGPRFR